MFTNTHVGQRLKLKKTKIFILTVLLVSTTAITSGAYSILHSAGYSGVPASIKCYSGFSSGTITAINNSCLAWNLVHDGDLVYKNSKTHSNTKYPYFNEVNEITKGYRGSNNYLMQTYYIYHSDTTIFEADIDINVSFPFGTASTSYDTQSVMTHEVGHLLGLDHSSNSAANMYYSFNPGEIRGVHQDDINGINAIY